MFVNKRNVVPFLLFSLFSVYVFSEKTLAQVSGPSVSWGAYIGDLQNSGAYINAGDLAPSPGGFIIATGEYSDSLLSPGSIVSIGNNFAVFPSPAPGLNNYTTRDAFFTVYDSLSGLNLGITPTIASVYSTNNVLARLATADSLGNLYFGVDFTGYFLSTNPLNVNLFVNPPVNFFASGNNNFVLQKYTLLGSGNYWANMIRGLNTLSGVEVVKVIIDPLNYDVYLAGSYYGAVDFNPDIFLDLRNSVGNRDLFVSKYSSTGSYQWTITFATGNSSTVKIAGLVKDANNLQVAVNVPLSTSNGVNLPGWVSNPVFGHGTTMNNEILLLEIDPSTGSVVGVGNIGGSANDYATDLTMLINGDLAVSGTFNGTADFDKGAGISNYTAVGTDDPFIAVYRGSSLLWLRQFPGVTASTFVGPAKITYSNCGNLLMSGKFSVSPGASVPSVSLSSGVGVYLSKLDFNNGNTMYNFPIYSASSNVDVASLKTIPSTPADFAIYLKTGYWPGSNNALTLGVFTDSCP